MGATIRAAVPDLLSRMPTATKRPSHRTHARHERTRETEPAAGGRLPEPSRDAYSDVNACEASRLHADQQRAGKRTRDRVVSEEGRTAHASGIRSRSEACHAGVAPRHEARARESWSCAQRGPPSTQRQAWRRCHQT